MTSLPRIKVSDNHRFLVTEDGNPFFWLGDTAWELFHRCSREEARLYFLSRCEKHFNVIQAVVLGELDGLNTPNAYGERPLIENDPTRPNEAYFAYVDALIQMAAEYHLYIALLPTWGDKITPIWGVGPLVFTEEAVCYAYGRFLGERYRHQTNLLWVLGGDRPAVTRDMDYRPLWRAMAEGITAGMGFKPFMTYHPNGGVSSAEWLHGEEWLDMHMMQSGHGGGHDVPVWEWIHRELHLTPPKPTLDAEMNYEDHPVNPWPKWDPALGFFRDDDVRRQMYRSVFAGGCGVTYGHHAIWQMFGPGKELCNQPAGYEQYYWYQALERPGARQVRHLRTLIEARPYLTRIADQSLIRSPNGERGEHMRATRDSEGSYAFVYLPKSQPVRVTGDWTKSGRLRAWWYDPRTGEAHPAGEFGAQAELTFTPPAGAADWVLVLDDAAAGFAAPAG